MDTRMNNSAFATIKMTTIFIVFGLGACATVDLTPITSIEQSVETTPQVQNVVIRSAQAVRTTFEAKGWTNVSAKNKQSIASIFLNGVSETSEKVKNMAFPKRNEQQYLTDISFATEMLEQTAKAAEVFYAMVTEDVVLDNELAALEGAILAAQKAEDHFETAYRVRFDNGSNTALETYRHSLTNLNLIANEYGGHIRQNISVKAVNASADPS
jgi:hypothetical protein